LDTFAAASCGNFTLLLRQALKGQSPHDVLPGAFIAMVSDAKFWDMDQEKYLSKRDLVDKLLKPGETKIQYILGANKGIVDEMKEILSSTDK
jgi:hypothetical protein